MNEITDSGQWDGLTSGEKRMALDALEAEINKCPPDCAYCNDPFFGHPKPHHEKGQP